MRDVLLLTVVCLFVVVAVEGKSCNTWRDCDKCSHPLLDRYCDNNHCLCIVNQVHKNPDKKCMREEDCDQCPVTLFRACSSSNHCICIPLPNMDLSNRYCKKWYHCERCPRHYFRTCYQNDCVCEHLTEKCETKEDCKICRPPFITDCGLGDLCLCRPKGYISLIDPLEEELLLLGGLPAPPSQPELSGGNQTEPEVTTPGDAQTKQEVTTPG